jgi:hypothetical protein
VKNMSAANMQVLKSLNLGSTLKFGKEEEREAGKQKFASRVDHVGTR